jgi:hypothetical protein
MLAETTNIDLGSAPFLFGLFVGLLIAFLFAQRRRTAVDRSALFASGPVPELGAAFDITQRYDITCAAEGREASWVERLQGVTLLGYAGPKRGEPLWHTHVHSRWLVVAFPDGRRAYLLPRSIKMLVQSAGQA